MTTTETETPAELTGRALDKRVAKLRGWHDFFELEFRGEVRVRAYPKDVPRGLGMDEEVPRYSSDPAAAHELYLMCSKFGSVETSCGYMVPGHFCKIVDTRGGTWPHPTQETFAARGDTFGEAICRAFVACMEKGTATP